MTTSAAGQFLPELALGLDAIDEAAKAAIQEYLLEVITRRGYPIHTAVAWNSLHFGYDLATGSYDAAILGAKMPTVELQAVHPALPVGALMWLELGGQHGQAWAEVVGKEGRPHGLEEDGTAPPDLARRQVVDEDLQPSSLGSERHVAVLDEALICDFSILGRLDGVESVLDRLSRRGRLGRHRLVEMKAEYDPPEAAGDDDQWFYARWLFDQQRHLLWSGPLGRGLTERDDEVLRSALLTSIETVDFLLTSIPGLVRWRNYTLLEEWVGDIDWSLNVPLGRSDLVHLARSMAYSREGGPTCISLGRCIEQMAPEKGATPERPDAEAIDLLDGLGYLKVVARSSRWLADYMDDSKGVVSTASGERILRLDDAWAWGGLWRSEASIAGHPLLGVPADEPFGIGSFGLGPLAEFLELPLEEVEARAAGEFLAPSKGPLAEDEGVVPEEPEDPAQPLSEEDLDATYQDAYVTLRAADIAAGTLPLSGRFPWLSENDKVTVVLRHDGDIEAEQVSQPGALLEDEHVRRIRVDYGWPIDFFIGIRVHLTTMVGKTTLFASTIQLADPVVHDGILYRFAFDESISGQPCLEGEITLSRLLVRLLARRGHERADETRRATARELRDWAFGPDVEEVLTAVKAALDAACEDGRLGLYGSEYTWSKIPRVVPRQIAPRGWERRAVRGYEVRAHWVVGFIRYLPTGYRASAIAQERYAEVRSMGLIDDVGERLPEGVTFVVGHERGIGRGAYLQVLQDSVSGPTQLPLSTQEAEDIADEWGSA